MYKLDEVRSFLIIIAFLSNNEAFYLRSCDNAVYLVNKNVSYKITVKLCSGDKKLLKYFFLAVDIRYDQSHVDISIIILFFLRFMKLALSYILIYFDINEKRYYVE